MPPAEPFPHNVPSAPPCCLPCYAWTAEEGSDAESTEEDMAAAAEEEAQRQQENKDAGVPGWMAGWL
jgi:hypothetical protein